MPMRRGRLEQAEAGDFAAEFSHVAGVRRQGARGDDEPLAPGRLLRAREPPVRLGPEGERRQRRRVALVCGSDVHVASCCCHVAAILARRAVPLTDCR